MVMSAITRPGLAPGAAGLRPEARPTSHMGAARTGVVPLGPASGGPPAAVVPLRAGLEAPTARSAGIATEFASLGQTHLERGDRGGQVRLLQRALRELGFTIDVDGIFGPQTEDILVQFQARYAAATGENVVPDGELGPITGNAIRQALRSAGGGDWNSQVPEPEFRNDTSVVLTPLPSEAPASYAPMLGLRQGADSAAVAQLQRELVELGYVMPVDGDFGPMTRAAVEDFQRLYETLTGYDIGGADGVIGRNTLRALAHADAINLFEALPSYAREGRVVRAFENGREQRIVVRNIGHSARTLETRAALAFIAMSDRAADLGIEFNVSSAFRTHQRQRELYDYYVRRLGQTGRAARPGYSKHQNGIALDVRAQGGRGQSWFESQAGDFGWMRPGYRYRDSNGNTAVEHWHWEFRESTLTSTVSDYWRLEG